MFAPTGYVPFNAITNDALDDSLYFQAEGYLAEEARSLLSFALERRDDLILTWVLDHCQESLYVCNVKGGLLKIEGRQLFSHSFPVDITYSYRSERTKAIEFPAEIRRSFKLCEPLGDSEIDSFIQLVEGSRGKKAADETVNEEIRAAIRDGAQTDGMTHPPMFVNLVYGSIDLSLFRHLRSLDGALDDMTVDDRGCLETFAQTLSQIEGWYLCVPQQLYGSNWEEYCKNRSEKHKKKMDDLLSPEFARRGRPRKQEIASRAFEKIYPTGREGRTWPTAARRVSAETGEDISVDTLKRGLGLK